MSVAVEPARERSPVAREVGTADDGQDQRGEQRLPCRRANAGPPGQSEAADESR